MNLVVLRPPAGSLAGESAAGLTDVAVPAPFAQRRPWHVVAAGFAEPYWRSAGRGRPGRRPGSRIPADHRHRLALRWVVRQRCRWRT